jgi:hypothetical protein
MSTHHPYVVRVYFDHGRGFARQIGMPQRELATMPAIEGLPEFLMLDYIPQVIALIQPFGERARDMDAYECRSVARWLETMKGLW